MCVAYVRGFWPGSHVARVSECSMKKTAWRLQAHRVHRSTAGHAGPVYACARAGSNKGYLTAGKDGFVMLWDGELQKLKQVPCLRRGKNVGTSSKAVVCGLDCVGEQLHTQNVAIVCSVRDRRPENQTTVYVR